MNIVFKYCGLTGTYTVNAGSQRMGDSATYYTVGKYLARMVLVDTLPGHRL